MRWLKVWVPAFAGMTEVRIQFPASSHCLENGGNSLATADALGGQRIALAFAFQERRGLARNPCAGGAQGMAQRQSSAIQVHFAHVYLEVADTGDGLRRKSLVQFDDVDIIDGQPCPLQRFPALPPRARCP